MGAPQAEDKSSLAGIAPLAHGSIPPPGGEDHSGGPQARGGATLRLPTGTSF
jgi:hypothetical protein